MFKQNKAVKYEGVQSMWILAEGAVFRISLHPFPVERRWYASTFIGIAAKYLAFLLSTINRSKVTFATCEGWNGIQFDSQVFLFVNATLLCCLCGFLCVASRVFCCRHVVTRWRILKIEFILYFEFRWSAGRSPQVYVAYMALVAISAPRGSQDWVGDLICPIYRWKLG